MTPFWRGYAQGLALVYSAGAAAWIVSHWL